MLRSNVSKVVLLTFFARLHFYIHIYSLLMQYRGLTLFEINALDSIVLFAMFAAEVPTGVIADRIGCKRSLVMGMFLHGLGEFLVLFAYSFGSFALAGVTIGLGFAFSSGALEALVYDTLPKADRENAMKRAMGSIGSAGQLGFVLSPLIGSIIVAGLTPAQFDTAIILTSGALLVAVSISLTLREPEADPDLTKPSPLEIFRDGLTELRDNKALRLITAVTVLTAFGGALLPLVPPHFVAHDAHTLLIGLSVSLGSLLAALTQKYATLFESLLGKRAGLTLAILLPGVMFLLLALATGAYSIFVWVVLIYGFSPVKQPLLSAYQNAHIKSQSRATVLSMMNMLSGLWIALGTLLAGALAEISISLVFALTGGVIILTVLILRVDQIPLMSEQDML